MTRNVVYTILRDVLELFTPESSAKFVREKMQEAKDGDLDSPTFTVFKAVRIPDTLILDGESTCSDRQIAWTDAHLVGRERRKQKTDIVELFSQVDGKVELGELIAVVGVKEGGELPRYFALLHTLGEVLTTPRRQGEQVYNAGLDTDVDLYLFKRKYEKLKGIGGEQLILRRI